MCGLFQSLLDFFIPVPPYPIPTLFAYGNPDRRLTHMVEGMQVYMECSAPPTGPGINVILTVYNGTNAVNCITPDKTEGEIVIALESRIRRRHCIP